MAVCVSGLMTFGLLQGYLQERMFEYAGWSFGWFMTFVQMQVFVLASATQLVVLNRSSELWGVPWKKYLSLALPLALNQGLGQAALSHVNFPTKVIFKSSKLIPTMLLGLTILKKTYSIKEYLAAFILVAGVIEFSLVDAKVSPRFTLAGVLMLSASVVADAVSVNVQEHLLLQVQSSKEQMMVASNLAGSAWVFAIIALSGELTKAAGMIMQNPAIGLVLLLEATCQYTAISFYLALVEVFGGVVAVSVTSCRKVRSFCCNHHYRCRQHCRRRRRRQQQQQQ